MALAVAVGLLGAFGAVARYLLDGAVQDRTRGLFPFGTLTVNVLGSFVLGILAGLALHHAGTKTAKTVIGTGFCGGLTTWSTASWEAVRLFDERATALAIGYTMVNLAASVAGAGLGLVLSLH